MLSLVTKAPLAALVSAGAANALALQQHNSQCVPFTDNFDDIATSSSILGNPVGIYHGINYTSFNVDAPMITGGAQPESPPNAIFASLSDELLTGQVALSPFGTLSRGPGVPSFDLQEFVGLSHSRPSEPYPIFWHASRPLTWSHQYFGCDVDLRNPLLLAIEGCTIAVTGFTVDEQQVPVASFSFAPKTLTDKLVRAVLPSSFSNLKVCC